MNKYESVVIINPNLDEEGTKAVVKKFTDLINSDGKLEKADELGKRRLAYEVKKNREGYYVVFYFEANTSLISELERNSFEIYTPEDKQKALQEAVRVTKSKGIILIAYCMNEYSILTHGFKDNYIKESLATGKVNDAFRVTPKPEDLYDYMRLEDIEEVNESANVKRLQIIAADGPANYMRQTLNAMDDETYELFIKYHLSTCERPELLGASAHTLDILQKQ